MLCNTAKLCHIEEDSHRKSGTVTIHIISIYHLVMISMERAETAQKSTLEIQDKFSPRQNVVQDKIQSMNFFLMVGNFFLSQTVFVSD